MGAGWPIHWLRRPSNVWASNLSQADAAPLPRLATPNQNSTETPSFMASIRLTFPEKDEPSVIALNGSRITVGRLPFNTLQIIDRTLSGFHAELIMDDGHYRLHDRGSTNGTFVNGEPATDFHLREACRISFGTVECEFDPAAGSEAQAEAVPTRGEINTVRQENAELRGTLAALREERAALLETKPADGAEPTVARGEFTKIVAEREALKEAQLRHEQEIATLKGELAVLRRDRANLQKAWDATKAELEKVRPAVEAVAVVEIRPPTAAALAAVVEAEAAAPAEKIVLAEEKAPAPIAPTTPASAPFTLPTPLSRPTVPLSPPSKSIAPPAARPFPGLKPASPPSRIAAAPTVTAKMPPANSSGIRPFPRAVPGVPSAAPAVVVAPKVVPGAVHPRTSVMPVHAPVGPKGTQKID